MKTLKFVIAIALLNAVVLTGVVGVGLPKKPQQTQGNPDLQANGYQNRFQLESQVAPSPSLTPTQPTSGTPVATATTQATPTPTPATSTNPTTPTPAPTQAATPTPPPTPTPTLTPAPTPTPPPSNLCVIQVDGVSYDVTQFRRSHSGGDIFQCGTDMSAIFWQEHNQSILNKMGKYRI